MRAALAEAEQGAFQGWYGPDRIFAVNARIEEITGLLQAK